MTESERNAKFLDCAGRVLGEVGARRALDLAIGVRSLGNVADLARAMAPAQERVVAQHGAPAG
jgi:hypothetical protein